MKEQNIYIIVYSALLMIGGMIGYFVAGSTASLVMSVLFALLLLICTIFMSGGNQTAYDVALGAILILFLFFSYRFFLSCKFMPGGFMAVVSAVVLAWLSYRRFSCTGK
jgi:uncharacterized membrane protein (UPF0136 family)